MRFAARLVTILLVAIWTFGCVRENLPPTTPTASGKVFHVDDALLPEKFASGWKAVPGSYIYAASEDELWKIYDGAAPGIISDGGREAVTQGYENGEGGGDRSFRVFILCFVGEADALATFEKEVEEAEGGERLDGVDAGLLFEKGKAPWARFVRGRYLVSINWEGSTDDTANAALEAAAAIAGKIPTNGDTR